MAKKAKAGTLQVKLVRSLIGQQEGSDRHRQFPGAPQNRRLHDAARQRGHAG